MIYKNPIIPGFYPDPSICKANGKYYLVTSTFQYFPGVPVFESVDLINWEQIGFCLTRKSQLPLENARSSGGIFAPTIRYNNNRFYMITTNVDNGGNFYVYTDDIYGEWSEPIWLKEGGIDPSLYFEDGRAYFTGTGQKDGRDAIFQCEIDIETGESLSESRVIWHGTGGRYLEGPHLYKIGGYYYIMASEGGTEYGHMITYARSQSIFGEFENYSGNPVLTNRNLGGYIIQGVGHADLFEDYGGNFWLVHLGFRQIDKWLTFHHLGRETFLTPVNFSDGWFTAGDDGTVKETVTTARIAENVKQHSENVFTFQNHKYWQFLREYNPECYKFTADSVTIKGSQNTLDDAGCPAFMALRQVDFNTELSVKAKNLSGEIGATVYMDENHHYDLAIIKKADDYCAVLRLCVGNIRHEQGQIRLSSDTANLKITSDALEYRFYCNDVLLGTAETRYLSSEVAGGFTGVMLGLYAQKEGAGEFSVFSVMMK